MLLPSDFALSGNSLSQTVKQYFDISGMLERSGRIFAPAGIMWSVVMLSPTLSEHLQSITSSSGLVAGNGFMFGPRRISTLSISFSSHGATTILSFIINSFGSSNSGISPKSLGSVRTPAIAEAAAVSGDTR